MLLVFYAQTLEEPIQALHIAGRSSNVDRTSVESIQDLVDTEMALDIRSIEVIFNNSVCLDESRIVKRSPAKYVANLSFCYWRALCFVLGFSSQLSLPVWSNCVPEGLHR